MNPIRPSLVGSRDRARPRLPALREAELYCDSALRGNQVQAQGLMHAAMNRGFSMTEASVRMVQPAMIEIGRMWQDRLITVAREHVATAITQNVLARAYMEAEFAPPIGRKVLFACVPGNHHNLGLRILADAFEASGWTPVELGAQVTVARLIAQVDLEMPELVCLSVSLADQLPSARDTVDRLRAEFGSRCPTLWVGGQGTLGSRHDREAAGADGWAADALHAVEQAQGLR